MARGRNHPPSAGNKGPAKTKTIVAPEKEQNDNSRSSSEEITLPRASRTTRRSLTVAKEQNVKDNGKKDSESTAASSTGSNLGRLRSQSRKNTQSSADSSNLNLSVDNESIVTENIVCTITNSAEGTSFVNSEEVFLDINNVANVVEISDFSHISSNTLTESSDSDDKQTITLSDKLNSFETGSFAMSSLDEDSQSQSDSVLAQQDENSNNQDEILTVIETADSVHDDEILLEISTDQSVKINPSLYAFASPPHDSKFREESSGESSLDAVQKDSPTPASNTKSNVDVRDTSTPDRAVSSPEILHVHTNSKAPRTYQNRRKTRAISSTNVQKTMQTSSAIEKQTVVSPIKVIELQDKSNIIQDKFTVRQDSSSNPIECRRSQRNRIIKYDVRDLLNKNRKSKIQIESKVVLKPKLPEVSPMHLSNEKSSEGYDTDRSSLMDSPQVFRGFSDSDNSKMSPITIKEKLTTPDSCMPLTSGVIINQRKEISIQTDPKKDVGIELPTKSTENLENLLSDIMTKGSTSKAQSLPKELKRKEIPGNKSTVHSDLVEEIIVLDDIKEQSKSSKARSRASSGTTTTARRLRGKQVTVPDPIVLSNEDTTDEDDLPSTTQSNAKKPTRTQEIFTKCLKRSQRVESLIDRNIPGLPKRKSPANLSKSKLITKFGSSNPPAEFGQRIEQVINLADDSSSDSYVSGKQTTERKVRQTRSKRNQSICMEYKGSTVLSPTAKGVVNKSKLKNKTAEIAFVENERFQKSETVFEVEVHEKLSTVSKSANEDKDTVNMAIQNIPEESRTSERGKPSSVVAVHQDCEASGSVDKDTKFEEVVMLGSSGDLQEIVLSVSNEMKTCSRARPSLKKAVQEAGNSRQSEFFEEKDIETVHVLSEDKELIAEVECVIGNTEGTEIPLQKSQYFTEGLKDEEKTAELPGNADKDESTGGGEGQKTKIEDDVGDERKIPPKKRCSQRKTVRDDTSSLSQDNKANVDDMPDVEKSKLSKGPKKLVKSRESLRKVRQVHGEVIEEGSENVCSEQTKINLLNKVAPAEEDENSEIISSSRDSERLEQDLEIIDLVEVIGEVSSIAVGESADEDLANLQKELHELDSMKSQADQHIAADENSAKEKDGKSQEIVPTEDINSSSEQDKIDADQNVSDNEAIIILDDDIPFSIQPSLTEVEKVSPKRRRSTETTSRDNTLGSEEDVPLKKRTRRLTRSFREIDAGSSKIFCNETITTETVMEIIVGDHANKMMGSEQLKATGGEDEVEQPWEPGKSDEIAEIKCNRISGEEEDQSRQTDACSRRTSQSDVLIVESEESKTEELAAPKTEEIKETGCTESIEIDKEETTDLKEMSPEKTKEDEGNESGTKRTLHFVNRQEKQMLDDTNDINRILSAPCDSKVDVSEKIETCESDVEVAQVVDDSIKTVEGSDEKEYTSGNLSGTSIVDILQDLAKLESQELETNIPSSNVEVENAEAGEKNKKLEEEQTDRERSSKQIIEQKISPTSDDKKLMGDETEEKVKMKSNSGNSTVQSDWPKSDDSKVVDETGKTENTDDAKEQLPKLSELEVADKTMTEDENDVVVTNLKKLETSAEEKKLDAKQKSEFSEKPKPKTVEDSLSGRSADLEKEKKFVKRSPAKPDFGKLSSKEERERILNSLYCPQKTTVKRDSLKDNASFEKSKALEMIEKEKKLHKQQSSSKLESHQKTERAKTTTSSGLKKDEDKRSSITKDRIEERSKDWTSRSKYEKESKWRDEKTSDSSKTSSGKKDLKGSSRDSPRDYKSKKDTSRDVSISKQNLKSDKLHKSRNEEDQKDKIRKTDTTPAKEKIPSKGTHKSYDHDMNEKKKVGKGSSVDPKIKPAKHEDFKSKERIILKSLKPTKSLDQSSLCKNENKLKSSKTEKSLLKQEDQEKVEKLKKTNMEKDDKSENAAISDVIKAEVWESEVETEFSTQSASEGKFDQPCVPDEESATKGDEKNKIEIVETKEKEKRTRPRRSRWDEVKPPSQETEHNDQKTIKINTEIAAEYPSTIREDNKEQTPATVADEITENNEEKIKPENHSPKLVDVGIIGSESTPKFVSSQDSNKSVCPLISKAALKAYPVELNFDNLSYSFEQRNTCTPPLKNTGLSSALVDFDEKSEVDKENRPLIPEDNKSQPQQEKPQENDCSQEKSQDDQTSPKEDSQDSQEDSNSANIRRSDRLKIISKTKQSVGRGLVRDKERFIDSDDRSQFYTSSADLEAENAKFLKDMEERLSRFEIIKENEYKCERVISKEAKKMICDCFLTREDEERGELGCGEDCLNRLLMIECGQKCVVGDRCTNKRFQKNLYAPCKVFRTEKKGFGIMADGEILPGEFIMEYVGEVLNDTQFMKRAEIYSQDKNKHYYFMALRSDAIIDATAKGNISRFINHSCDPNAETQKWTVNGELRIGFFSRRKIYPGEEITFDYQFQRYGKEAQKCFCESTNCRGWIGEEPDSEEEEDEEVSSESEEEEQEQIVPELEKDKEIVDNALMIGKDGKVDIESTPMPVPPPTAGIPLPVPPPLPLQEPIISKDMEKPELKLKPKPLSVIQEKAPDKRKKIKRRKEFRLTKKKMEYLEDPDLEEEIMLLTRSGLKNQAHTLSLSRLMVRAKMLGTRIRLLEILRTGEMPCKRLFLDYHGLRLLHGWMNENEIKDIEKDLEVRLLIIQTLEILPIPNKTLLKESKVFQTVQGWASEKEIQSSSPNDDSPSDSGSATPIISEGQQLKKVNVSPVQVSENTHPLRTEIMRISNKLLTLWDGLPEVFRIPKRERIEQMKEHEREADRQYKALNLADEDNEGLTSQLRNERFGKAKKRSGSNKYKWSREQVEKEKKTKEKDESEKTDIDPNLTKVQRRQLFAAKVAKDEEEKRLAEERREFEVKCKFYGLDPTRIQPKDLPFCVNPATGQWYTADKKKIETPPSHAHIQVPPKPQSTDPKDYRLPVMDLPPLWKFAIDSRGRIYYYHIKIRIPQWEPPIKIEPLTGSLDQRSEDPMPSTSKAALEGSGDRNGESSSSSDSDESVPESKIRKIDDESANDDGTSRHAADAAEARRERRKERYSLLVQERAISPRREEDRIYNQLEMKRYKENKEKIRRRREEIKRKKALLLKEGGALAAEAAKQPDGLALPIQDYLISSDEEEQLKSDCDSPLLEKFVQGDKIVDELDALKREKPLKRPLPIKDKHEYKKRQKLEERKRPEEAAPKETKSSQRSNRHNSAKYLARKAKDKFRCDIAGVIVQHLTPYRKESCQIGRITNNDDFKHLARKLTHFVMIKELKHCDSTGQILEVTESVKNKSREFIKKYMAKYGEVYIRPENDPEFKDIPHKD